MKRNFGSRTPEKKPTKSATIRPPLIGAYIRADAEPTRTQRHRDNPNFVYTFTMRDSTKPDNSPDLVC